MKEEAGRDPAAVMEVVGAAASPCRPRSARYADKGYPNYAVPDDVCAAATPQSARYAEKGCPKRDEGGVPVKKPVVYCERKRRRTVAETTDTAVDRGFPLLQGEEAVSQDGEKTSRTAAAATATAMVASEVFPLPEGNEEVAPVEGGADQYGGGGGGGKSWTLRAKETLRAFSSNFLHFLQVEDRRAQAVKVQLKAARALKCQKANGQDDEGYEEVKRPTKRTDLKAIRKMQATSAILYPEKRIGHLPGIDVGYQFYSRAEMVVLGMHSHWLSGIDYMGMKYRDKLIKQKGYEDLTFPFATCIVMSGRYEDDLDKADEIIYTGQGGNNLFGNCHLTAKQKMVRGNLALKNSKYNGNPIRVIRVRGHEEKSNYTQKVIKYWAEPGVQGHLVFKYKLKRLEGQPPLTTSRVLFTRGKIPMEISELPGLVCCDISHGQENFPIPATNLVDNPPVPPSGFVYSKSLQIPKDIEMPADSIGCNCKGDCSSSKHCLCADLNGSEF